MSCDGRKPTRQPIEHDAGTEDACKKVNRSPYVHNSKAEGGLTKRKWDAARRDHGWKQAHPVASFDHSQVEIDRVSHFGIVRVFLRQFIVFVLDRLQALGRRGKVNPWSR